MATKKTTAKKSTARSAKPTRTTAKRVAKPKSAKNASAKTVQRGTASRVQASRSNAASAAATRQTAASSKQTAMPANPMAGFSEQSEAMLRMGTETVRQLMNMANGEAASSPFNGQFAATPNQGAEQMAKSADMASRSLNEMMNLSKDNIETCVACSSIAVDASKNMGAELFNYANKSFAQNVEMGKEIFSCRTLNDMFDLQSKVMKSNLDHFFNESVKMSEMMFTVANQVSEPLNERITENTERLSKSFADAA